MSTATVSRVINSPDQVDETTRRTVRDAIAKLGYVPHGAARTLRSHRRMVGAVVPSFAYALYARTTSTMQEVLDPNGYAMVLAEHRYDLKAELRVTDQLIGHGVDASCSSGCTATRLFARLELWPALRPDVGVDDQPAPDIGFDDRGDVRDARRSSARPPALRALSAVTGQRPRLERGPGMRAALAQAGLGLDERCVQYGPIDLAAASGMMRKVLALQPRPTASSAPTTCSRSARWSRAASEACAFPRRFDHGVDNTDLGATQTPALTSIRTPIVEIAARRRSNCARLETRPLRRVRHAAVRASSRAGAPPRRRVDRRDGHFGGVRQAPKAPRLCRKCMSMPTTTRSSRRPRAASVVLCRPGMRSKFIPKIPVMSVNGMKIAVISVSSRMMSVVRWLIAAKSTSHGRLGLVLDGAP